MAGGPSPGNGPSNSRKAAFKSSRRRRQFAPLRRLLLAQLALISGDSLQNGLPRGRTLDHFRLDGGAIPMAELLERDAPVFHRSAEDKGADAAPDDRPSSTSTDRPTSTRAKTPAPVNVRFRTFRVPSCIGIYLYLAADRRTICSLTRLQRKEIASKTNARAKRALVARRTGVWSALTHIARDGCRQRAHGRQQVVPGDRNLAALPEAIRPPSFRPTARMMPSRTAAPMPLPAAGDDDAQEHFGAGGAERVGAFAQLAADGLERVFRDADDRRQRP